nr:reverse transcriptase domain-containing protein [Tanacetum cinerariifolium]
MADTRTMSKLPQVPTEGYGDAIVIPAIIAKNFELKVGLLSLVTLSQFHGFERDAPRSHIRWFNKITSMLKYKNVSHDAIKLMLFPFYLEGAARTWLEKEPPRSIHTCKDLISKFVNYFFPPSKPTNLKNDIMNFQQRFNETYSEACDRFKDLLYKCPHHGFSELHQINTFYNSLIRSNQDSLNAIASGNLLNCTPRDALTIIENKSKVRISRNKPVVTKVNTTTSSSSPSLNIIALTDIVKELMLMNKANQQASVKAVEETCVTCGGPHPYYECLATGGNTFDACATTGTYNQGGLESCMALADLGASINLMRLSIWKKLSLPNLTPTRMTLELATRSFAYPAGISEDVFVQAGKFTFPADFVVVDYDVDPHVPLILGRLFLRTAHALVDVHREELILREDDEQLIFHADSTLKHPHKHGNESINMINLIDITCEDCFPEVLTPSETSDSLLEEFADELDLLDPFTPGNKDDNFDFRADLREIEYLRNKDPSTESNIETIDPILEKFTDEPALDYLPTPGDDDDDDDDIFDLKPDNDERKKLLYGDCYKDNDSEKDKNKDSKTKSLVVEAHIIESNDLLP